MWRCTSIYKQINALFYELWLVRAASPFQGFSINGRVLGMTNFPLSAWTVFDHMSTSTSNLIKHSQFSTLFSRLITLIKLPCWIWTRLAQQGCIGTQHQANISPSFASTLTLRWTQRCSNMLVMLKSAEALSPSSTNRMAWPARYMDS